jgi:hypothetical protein
VSDPAPPPLPPVAPEQPLPADRIFEGAGVFVSAVTDFPVTRAGELVVAHFGWVAAKIHDGTVVDPRNDAALRSNWVRDFHQMGLKVCGWGVNGDQPVAEARLVDSLISRYGLDCYIADAENAHMAGDYGGDTARSPAFVDEFRRLRPGFPAALSSYAGAPAPWVLPFLYDPWITAGFDFLPQAYLSISADYDPETAMAYAARVGWSKDKVHPTIGIGWSQGRPALSGAQQVDRLVAAANANAYGYSIFLGETTTRADILALGKANEEHLLVRAYDLQVPQWKLAVAAPAPPPAQSGRTLDASKAVTKSAALRAAERKVATLCKPRRKVTAACAAAKRALAKQKLAAAKQKPPAARRS